jgi:RNA recognition motif-containing protein
LDFGSVTKQDVEEHFATHGTGTIKEIKLMNGFGFIEYEDAMDAKDIVPGKFLLLDQLLLTLSAFHGSVFKGERLTVQFARGPRRKDDFGPSERNVPRPRRTIYRMNIAGLAPETSWQVRTFISLVGFD